jgi:ATP-dependent RNA helicase DDX42
LEMGFEAQVSSLVANIRPDAQRAMFSATFQHRIRRLAERSLNNPVRISVGTTGASSEHVEQHAIVLNGFEAKKEWILATVPGLAKLGQKTIVFVSSKADCEEVGNLLRHATKEIPQAQGSTPPDSSTGNGDSSSFSISPAAAAAVANVNPNVVIDTIHGDKHQHDRSKAMSHFKKGKILILVATDVASRGLDVKDVRHVINFDPAKSLDAHIHRVGRAGRLGGSDGAHQAGTAYTLLTWKNADFANALLDSFRREGRPVGDELVQLAQKSKHFVHKRG